jgi:AraC-like DNA-binding protein
VWCLAIGIDLVSCYLEATSDRAQSCRQKIKTWNGDVGVTHPDEDLLMHTPTDDHSARRWLDLAAPSTQRTIDPRIALAARKIREDPAATISSRQLAAEAALSESRFLHLFRDELGGNLTTAAADSGFASPSHLADSFKRTFGLSASQLLGTGLRLRTP